MPIVCSHVLNQLTPCQASFLNQQDTILLKYVKHRLMHTLKTWVISKAHKLNPWKLFFFRHCFYCIEFCLWICDM